MSLHLNQQCQRADAFPSPPKGRSNQRSQETQANRHEVVSAGEGPNRTACRSRQWLFSLVCADFGAGRSLKPPRPRRPERKALPAARTRRATERDPAPLPKKRRIHTPAKSAKPPARALVFSIFKECRNRRGLPARASDTTYVSVRRGFARPASKVFPKLSRWLGRQSLPAAREAAISSLPGDSSSPAFSKQGRRPAPQSARKLRKPSGASIWWAGHGSNSRPLRCQPAIALRAVPFSRQHKIRR
jgi:hypothetical protein